MLFITPSTSSAHAKDYFTSHMERSDYYLKESPEVSGQWHGLGAELLGVSGTVDKERYFQLCDNINPATGERLTGHTKKERRVAYDFTFDAPKSVSLAYEVGGDERIMDAFRSAVKDTMSEIESEIMVRVRSNKRDEDRYSSNLIWAEFIHRTTRPLEDGTPDPQCHCHAVCFNSSYDPEEKKWKAAQFGGIVRDKGYYQAAFHSRLAGNLANLGYGIEREGNSFRLAGIDTALTDRFSRRTDIIEAEAKRLGISNAKQKGELGARTRNKKDPNSLGISELRKLWAKRLTDEERDAIMKAREGQQTTSPDAAKAMDFALLHSFERASAVPEKELLKTALIQSVGNADVKAVHAELGRDNVIRRSKGGISYATTKEVLQEELSMSAFVREGRGRYIKLGGIEPPALDEKLSEEQRRAALVILESRDRVTAIKGGAGTGKTTLIRAVHNAIEETGKQVFLFAPSAEASHGVLRSEGFQNADTVERLLIDPKMQAKVKHQVLWVDEAGLLSVKDMKRLFDVAKAQDARVVLSGDTAQNQGVSRGDALRILQRDTGIRTAELKEIRRQTDEQYRSAVKAISEGDTPGAGGRTRFEAGMAMLDDMGAIIQAEDEERFRRIAEDYADVTTQRKHGGVFKTALVVSPTHKEAEAVTQAIREQLKKDGRIDHNEREFLSLRPLNFTEAQRGDAKEYRPGEVVRFVEKAKGFKRGERATVERVDGGSVKMKKADGSLADLPLQNAERFQVYEANSVALARGDKLRITINGLVERETRRGVFGNKTKDRLNNGSIYEVESFTREGNIRLTNGVVVPKNYGGIANGFVVTSHASQGKTVDVALVALGHDSFSAASREQAYVSVSRGREAVRIYTDDKEAMLDAVKSSAARLSASELVQAAPKPKASFAQRHRETIRRAYNAVLERISAHVHAISNRQREGLSLG